MRELHTTQADHLLRRSTYPRPMTAIPGRHSAAQLPSEQLQIDEVRTSGREHSQPEPRELRHGVDCMLRWSGGRKQHREMQNVRAGWTLVSGARASERSPERMRAVGAYASGFRDF